MNEKELMIALKLTQHNHRILMEIKKQTTGGEKMKAKFKDGHFNACYGGNTIYEKSTLQGMTKSCLIELIECAQNNYEVLLDERDYFHNMVLSMDKQLSEMEKK